MQKIILILCLTEGCAVIHLQPVSNECLNSTIFDVFMGEWNEALSNVPPGHNFQEAEWINSDCINGKKNNDKDGEKLMMTTKRCSSKIFLISNLKIML